MTIQKKPVCLSLWNDKFAEFNLHQHFGLDHASPMMKQLAELREKYDLHMRVERYVSDDRGDDVDEQFIRK